MKLKTILSTTMMSTLVLSMGATNVFATEQTLSPKGSVEFVAGDDEITPPVDPENPDPTNPVDPEDPETGEPEVPGGNKGPLSLDYASALYFGINKISSGSKTYFAKAQHVTQSGVELDVPNYAQVTDNRGTLEGWKLTVKQNGQFKTAEGKELNGAVISFENGSSESTSEESTLKVINTGFSLTADGTGEAITVLEADQGQGAGTYTYYAGSSQGLIEEDGLVNQDGEIVDGKVIKNHSISLEVPGGTTKYAKRYATTLTWTLSDVPGNIDGGDTSEVIS